MIELRWVEKTQLPEHDGATGFYYKVLQYRQAEFNEREDCYDWSDWIDVPTLTEP